MGARRIPGLPFVQTVTLDTEFSHHLLLTKKMSNKPAADQTPEINSVDAAVASGGSYEVLAKRLETQGNTLESLVSGLNSQRLSEFGGTQMDILGRMRVRTENNCIGQDIVFVDDMLVFGYNVFMGLKQTTRLEDVFSVFRLQNSEHGYDVATVDLKDTFLSEPGFVKDFNELYAYFKNTQLQQMLVRDGKLLISFQIGPRREETRVFRFSLDANGKNPKYIDNRGERDIRLPSPYDFDWIKTTRDNVVVGRNSHVNILDKLFVETINGTLTVKIENNTDDGLGIYNEDVEEKNQSIDDGSFEYAELGSLILLKILPYRETQHRYLVFNTMTQKVIRLDQIGASCVQLPSSHGIIFPGGYYLQNGEHRTFDTNMNSMRFSRMIRSPNGEDVLYVFYDQNDGCMSLFRYNMIERTLQPPIVSHGFTRLEDGRIVIFTAEVEPTRVHPMQIWSSPFVSDEFAAAQPQRDTFIGRIGNADLVSGISDLYLIRKEISAKEVSLNRYERLIDSTRVLFERYLWISSPEMKPFGDVLHSIIATGDSVIDEYEKVVSIRQSTDKTVKEITTKYDLLSRSMRNASWSTVDDYVNELEGINLLRGQLMSARDLRYVDLTKIGEMLKAVEETNNALSQKTAEFISTEGALKSYVDEISGIDTEASNANTVISISTPIDRLSAISAALDLLTDLMTSLKIDDANQRTMVVDRISSIYGTMNQVRARAEQRKSKLSVGEQDAQFSAQMSLYAQSIVSSMTLAKTPELADTQLAKLLIQIEEIESKFGEHEKFLNDIISKRDEVVETFEAHKQRLQDARQQRAQGVYDASMRIVNSLPKRAEKLNSSDALNAFFASDSLIIKVKELSDRLRNELFDAIKADDLDGKVKNVRDQAFRAMKDRTELYADGGKTIRLGKHQFSVGNQDLEMTLLPRGDDVSLHLVGTEYFEPINNQDIMALKDYWGASTMSESKFLSRSEFLALQVVRAARSESDGLSVSMVRSAIAAGDATLVPLVRDFAAPRFREGYERGVHDHDAAIILKSLMPLYDGVGVLRHAPAARALGMIFLHEVMNDTQRQQFLASAVQSNTMLKAFGSDTEKLALQADTANLILNFVSDQAIAADLERSVDANLFTGIEQLAQSASQYLFDQVASSEFKSMDFTVSSIGKNVVESIANAMSVIDVSEFNRMKEFWATKGTTSLQKRFASALNWALTAANKSLDSNASKPFAVEAAVMLCMKNEPLKSSETKLIVTVNGLLSQHARVVDGSLSLQIDELMARSHLHYNAFIPSWEKYQNLRQEVLAQARERIHIEEFKAKPLSSFVRNQIINQVYLPVIGDNLAKQIGTVGDTKRTDQMGLLMMISPPGYGKTTLMEYVANRLGLIFMKINGPALGHNVTNLDPSKAPDATSAKELEKLNLALEMSNNVMLYVDDIQHTSPEFLQKFISLSDGTRRIEGIWKGKTKTYDMRGKRFCVVMSGNPYTESGEVFKIPDMLANRADIYNLGDVIGGLQDVFKMSYIENSLTSNPVLTPLATRNLEDLYLLVRKCKGADVSLNDMSHEYSSAELREIEAVLERLISVSDLVFKVNQQYIASAAQDDAYRVEPPFKLQGSYRNMNKLTEKITSVMNEAEMSQLLTDHYQGEAQMLTTGAEENILKLKELRGVLTEEESARWESIKVDFKRMNGESGGDANHLSKIAAALQEMVEATREMGAIKDRNGQWEMDERDNQAQAWQDQVTALMKNIESSQTTNQAALKGILQAMLRRSKLEIESDESVIARFTDLLKTDIIPAISSEFSESRKLQIGLHKILVTVAAKMQTQIDRLRPTDDDPQAVPDTLSLAGIEKGFDTLLKDAGKFSE